MTSMKSKTGEWVFIFPVSNLELTEKVNNEFTIGTVTFIKLDKFFRVKKRFGVLQSSAEIKRQSSFERIITAKTIALVKKNGHLENARENAEKEVKEKLFILALSQLFNTGRDHIQKPSISKNNIYHIQSFHLNLHKSESGSQSKMRGPFFPLRLDEEWIRVVNSGFFSNAIKIINNDNKKYTNWDSILYRSLVLAGKSLYEEDISQSFLLTMIAIESIITSGNSNHQERFLGIFRALMGHYEPWQSYGFEGLIKSIYTKRNNYVHDGKQDEITIDDLRFAELLLYNLYLNIFKNISHFDSKEKLKDLLERNEAVNKLKLNKDITKYLPKGLVFTYKQKDILMK
ncbi:hypothetical protein [Shewanella acanthi]|uniref:hypothetical protein n=1 Tax=Shewanella acanthi TaxID=2864212 RepID=UPI001C65984F|nr:hypothetical protein [Shewanella acanthi]QYJ79437.1 hypothetical protein K0H61_03030 [Shewanella acanthi]